MQYQYGRQKYCKTHNYGTFVYLTILVPLIYAFLLAELILITKSNKLLIILVTRYFSKGAKVAKFTK